MKNAVCVRPSGPLRIRTRVPGDKSVSHRAVIFGALARGRSRVRNLLESEDCLRTVAILRALGTKIARTKKEWEIFGRGLRGFRAPKRVLDCGNSGTTMRLLAGLLAAQPFRSVLTGDASLRRRPMDRVVRPLKRMGARLSGRGKRQTAPLAIRGGAIHAVRYRVPIASAQVKSAVLLAGLYARGTTTVVEKEPTRDHTETFLRHTGVPLRVRGRTIRVEGGVAPRPFRIEVPGDPSSAAFILAAALLVPGSRVTVRGVLWNPTRNGFLRVLRRMGAALRVAPRGAARPEKAADMMARFSRLKGTRIKAREIPSLIDELPILMVAATQAHGRTRISGAGELRVKETDRIHSMVSQLRRMGAAIREEGDDVVIDGPTRLRGRRVESFGDHRTAMSFIVAGLIASGETEVRDIANIATSFPNFLTLLRAAGAIIRPA